MLMSTLVENTPASAYQLLTHIVSRGDTHAQQLFVYILRNRAANGMPLLTKMVPHFVPMLRKVRVGVRVRIRARVRVRVRVSSP